MFCLYNWEMSEFDSEANSVDTGRLERWQNERPIIKWFERNARRKIVSAIRRDSKEGGRGKISPEKVLRQVGKSLIKLEVLNNGEGVIAQLEGRDSVSGAEFISQIIREPEAWVAKEVDKTTGRVYTQARVGINGSTSLTLNFEQLDPRYNPQIVDSHVLPEATATTFNLLVGAVTGKRK